MDDSRDDGDDRGGGSDDVDLGPIAFGTDGWRGTLETFTDDRVRAVGQAVVDHLLDGPVDDPAGTEILVGYDARDTSPGFAESLAAVVADNGFDAVLPERDVPTPVLTHGILARGAAGGVMVTASHNPPEYNGVKFIPADGAPALPAVTADVERRLRPARSPDGVERGSIERVDLVADHARAVRALLADPAAARAAGEGGSGADDAADAADAADPAAAPPDLSGLTVAYDAMHGSGRGVTDALLSSLGAEVRRLRVERDPTFGGDAPEPGPGHLDALVETVRSGGADLGIANDGDADRLAVVTPERGVLDENLFFAATYDGLLADDAWTAPTGENPAVRTVSTTFLVDRVAEAHGESVVETPVGFKWVAAAMADHDALMGGEESGGFTVRGHGREKDGVMTAALAATLHAAEPYDERIDRLLDAHGAIVADKVSVDCPDEEKERVIAALGESIPDAVAGEPVAEVGTDDGFKLLLADGTWLLVRPSGTEPVLRVYAEAGSRERVDELLAAGRELIAPLL